MPSYGTDTGLIDYLASTGRALPVGANAAALRAEGTLWVDQWEPWYKSVALTDLNSFPREAWPVVPERVEYAAYEAAYASASGVDIWGAASSAGAGNVTMEKVDVLQIQYEGVKADSAQSFYDNARVMIPRAYALLQPYFKRHTGGAAAFVV